MDLYDSGYRPVPCSLEYNNEFSGCMKGKKCVVRFSNCQLFTKYSRGIFRLRTVSFIPITFYFYGIVVGQKFNRLKLSVFVVCATGVYITIICILPSQYVCVFRATLPIQQSCSRTALIVWPL